MPENETSSRGDASENPGKPDQISSVDTPESIETITWQKSLLPLMKWTVVVLGAFFFLTTIGQLIYVQILIAKVPQLDIETTLNTLQPTDKDSQQDRLAYTQWKTLSVLESNVIQRRYRQAALILMTRVWVIYLGFITGMILSLVGATFVLGKLREARSTLGLDSGLNETTPSMLKLSLQTASPGLILVLLGTVLMLTTILAHVQIDVKDGPQYLLAGTAELDKQSQIDGKTQPQPSPQGTTSDSGKPPKNIRSIDDILGDAQKDLSGSNSNTPPQSQKPNAKEPPR